MQIPYELIGKAAIYVFITVFVLAAVVLLFAAISFKRRKLMFPGFFLFLLDILYGPAKFICRTFFIRETLVDEILIEFRNAVNREKYLKEQGKKILIGPHCMRSPKCQSRCEPRIGYICTACGLCKYAKIKKACDKAGYLLFIIPGDRFVKKILALHKPKKVLGIACFEELNESMHAIAPLVPVQGIPLLKDGCYNTDVDLDEVIKKLEEDRDV
ncbi:MAG: DUF116 domain-containing protein [Candidatus Aenigmarchaeota archaeon]|nr:DUF116 domain-containing protein [Candidatus Aenigmarchaeota archaeon]